MTETKIINVAKEDSVDEVLDFFKNSPASEVIFIFPKGSRFSKSPAYLTAIKEEAAEAGKKISIMTGDQQLLQFAEELSIPLLDGGPVKKSPSPEILPEDSSRDFSDSPEILPRFYEQENGGEKLSVELATAKYFGGSEKLVKDIFEPKGKNYLPISEEKTREIKLEVDKPEGFESESDEKLLGIWNRKPISKSKGFRWPKFSFIQFKKAKKIWTAVVAVVFIGVILFVFLGSAKAQLIIRPKSEKVSFQIKTEASIALPAVNAEFNKIPGQQIDVKKEETGIFPLSGQKDVVQKATGEIIIYNKGLTEQKLVATTRFESKDGFIFRIPQSVVVPAGKSTVSGITPGSVKAVVNADRPGKEYNIGPNSFTIPGFQGNPKFDEFYATSEKPMVGGFIGVAKVVSETDYSSAVESLKTKLKEEISGSLKSQLGNLKMAGSAQVVFEEPIANAKIGEAPINAEGKSEELKITLAGRYKTVGFSESDIVNLAKTYISNVKKMELAEKGLSFSYQDPVLSQNGQDLKFTTVVSGTAFMVIKEEKIKNDILGLDSEAVRLYFNNQKEIESVRIFLSPFWVKTISKNPDKVQLQLVID
jgi:hypothetical protein